MPDSRFDFYEKVRVRSQDSKKASIVGELGAVLGKAEGDDGGWSYGVFIYSSEIVWSCDEDELIATGEFDRHETFYAGESIRVSPRGELRE